MNSIEYLSLPAPVSMTDLWYEIADKEHFWIQWRLEILKKFRNYLPLSPCRILEIGCGNGLVMQQLEQNFGYTADGCDLNIAALQQVPKGNGKIMLYNIFDRNPNLLGNYSAIFLMDVLEHIADDTDFLSVATQYIKPGGIVIINVPAMMTLFSKYDIEAGHQRRYSRKTLFALLSKAGIEPLKAVSWGEALLPVALLRKIILYFTKKEKIIRRGFHPPTRFINGFFKLLMKIEIAFPSCLFFGTSLMVIGKLKGVKTTLV